MPAKEIKALRQAGQLQEALELAQSELQAEPTNLWAMRNISWVYYDMLKQSTDALQFDEFVNLFNEIKALGLPPDERMLYDQMAWQFGKIIFSLSKLHPDDQRNAVRLFDDIKLIDFPKPTDSYSYLFKSLHKAFKNTDHYIPFADWWDFKNFLPKDFEKEKLENGKEIMALAEQAYIAYAKCLLPKRTMNGELKFDRDKTLSFLPYLGQIVEQYPKYQYPAYYMAKLLLALGEKENMLGLLLPFAKKKQNDFWVWEILAEAFDNDVDKVFACYCKALSCKSPEEMLVNLRQKTAKLMIDKNLFSEAKTEIKLLLEVRMQQSYKIPPEVMTWQQQSWFSNTSANESNLNFYKSYVNEAESLLFGDIQEELVLVEYVNKDRQILNFIASGEKFGFFKYDKFLTHVKIGDILKVRFHRGSQEGLFRAATCYKSESEEFKSQFVKNVQGTVQLKEGKTFAFVGDVFIAPGLVKSKNLSDGMELHGLAIKSYNKEKKTWGWKLID